MGDDDDSIFIGLGCVFMSYDAYDCSSAGVVVGTDDDIISQV